MANGELTQGKARPATFNSILLLSLSPSVRVCVRVCVRSLTCTPLHRKGGELPFVTCHRAFYVRSHCI